ncbi:MAG: tetratricopeptide repeat protein, partial [Rhodothermaceae bacterium]|nr:tetratricopeptide repeat protein [Rhodothermaceae bacterium]
MTLNRFFLLASLCLLMLVSAPGVALAQQHAAAQSRAAAAISEGQYREAISILDPIVEANPNDTRSFMLRARAHEGRDSYARALADYRRVLQLDPDNSEALQAVTRVSERQNTTTRAGLDGLRLLVEANPDNLQYRLRYADALYNAELYRDAAAQYTRYLDSAEGTPDVVRRYLIALAGYPGDNAIGERVAARALTIYPTDDDLHMRLGYFRYWQGKTALAQQSFEQALLLNPGNKEAQRGLDLIRNPQQAAAASTYRIDVLARQLRDEPNNDDLRFELIEALVEADRFFEARQNLDRLPPRYRTSAEWQRFDARVKAGLQRSAGPARAFAADRLLADLRRDPNNDEKRFQLVRELIQYGRFAEAYDHLAVLTDSQGQTLEEEYGETARWLDLFVQVDAGFMRTTGASPIFPVDRFTYLLRAQPSNDEARYALVDELLNRDRVVEAFDILTAPGYLDSGDERYQSRLAEVTEARQQVVQANIARLEARRAANPDDPIVLSELSEQYLVAYRVEDALDALALVLQRNPDNLNVRFRYAEVLRQTGRFEDALIQASFLA